MNWVCSFQCIKWRQALFHFKSVGAERRYSLETVIIPFFRQFIISFLLFHSSIAAIFRCSLFFPRLWEDCSLNFTANFCKQEIEQNDHDHVARRRYWEWKKQKKTWWNYCWCLQFLVVICGQFNMSKKCVQFSTFMLFVVVNTMRNERRKKW